MDELKPCPYCGGKTSAHPFISKIVELPEPIPLFGRWSLLKMRYREIPCNWTVDCDDFCEGFTESEIFIVAETRESAIEKWNEQ